MSEDGRPTGVVLDDGGGPVADTVAALRPHVRVVDVVDAPTVAEGLADALRSATTGWVLTAPASAVGLDAEDVAELLAAAGPRGVIATDGVRDVPALGLWPRARVVEVAVAARGGSLSLLTASMGRHRVALRVLGRDPAAADPPSR